MAECLQAGGAGGAALQRQTGQHEQVGKLLSHPVELHTDTERHVHRRSLTLAEHVHLLFAHQYRREFELWLDRMTQISLMRTGLVLVVTLTWTAGLGDMTWTPERRSASQHSFQQHRFLFVC